MRNILWRCALLGLLAFGPCQALAAGGQDWSVVTGRTLGSGATSIHVQAAWPGISFSILHGASPGFDLGGIVTYNYNYEGDVRASFPGIKVQGYFKGTLAKSSKYSLGLWFAPGMLAYFLGQNFCTPIVVQTFTPDVTVGGVVNACSGVGGTQYGVTLPSGLVFGVTVSDKVKIALNLDVPFFVTFGDYGTPTIPILFGGGVEYFLDRSTAVTFTLRTGPMIFTKYGTDFTFQALLGIAYRF